VTDPHVEYLAHHWILLAGPAFLPAVIVVGVVLYVAIRDRRRAGDDAERSDAEERRLIPAGDDAERSDSPSHPNRPKFNRTRSRQPTVK
jgi:hypothetical protein